MERLTYENQNGEWGIKGYDIKECPGGLYGAICKLHEYEKSGLEPDEVIRLDDFSGSQAALRPGKCQAYERLGVTPEQLKRIDDMYAERCREIAELKKRLDGASREEVKSKYCKTCKEIEEIDFYNKPFSSDEELIKVLNAQLVTKIFDRKRNLRGCMAYRARKINFCPECGKKIEESKKIWRM